jgi:polar amino acid transport system substrate-binding protein
VFPCRGKRQWTEPWFTALRKSASLYRSLPADIKAKGKLVFATDPTDPPFQFFSEDNDLIGAEIDLANAVGKILGVKVEFVTSGFSAIIPGVEAGRFDASVSAFAERVLLDRRLLISLTISTLHELSFSEKEHYLE